MTPEDSIYFDNLENMFATPGWKTFIEECKLKIYELQADALEAKSFDIVCEMRGKASQLQTVIDLEEITGNARKMMEAENASV